MAGVRCHDRVKQHQRVMQMGQTNVVRHKYDVIPLLTPSVDISHECINGSSRTQVMSTLTRARTRVSRYDRTDDDVFDDNTCNSDENYLFMM